MYAKPDIEELIEIAAELGFRLTESDAQSYRPIIDRQLSELDELMQARFEEVRPEMLFGDRERGHRPGPEEDPYRAWMWKCHFGGGDGILAGRTVSFKDHISVVYIPQAFSSFLLDDYVPDFDATVVTRALRAGATIIGKNVLAGFLGDYAKPINPHSAEHFTGGSSSGSAAAVCAGEVDISFGGDQGGSIRLPAAYCGIVGLKPTWALVSHMGAGFGNDPSIDHAGPLARRVELVAAGLQAVAGYDIYDPRQRREIPDHLDVLSNLEQGVEGLTIGILQEGFDDPTDEAVKTGVLEAIDVLRAAGAKVKEVSVSEHHATRQAFRAVTLEGSLGIFQTTLFGMWARTFYPKSVITTIDRMQREHADMLPMRTKVRLIEAELSRRNFHGAAYATAQNVRAGFVRAYDDALSDVDILAMPTMRTPAPLIKDLPKSFEESEADFQRTSQNLVPFDYTGHPALAVPCGKVNGLPISLQLVGRHLDDGLLLRAAYAYQQSVDFDAINAVSPS